MHVHTIHSGTCTVPVARYFRRESYNDTAAVYEKLKQSGMDLVTTENGSRSGDAGFKCAQLPARTQAAVQYQSSPVIAHRPSRTLGFGLDRIGISLYKNPERGHAAIPMRKALAGGSGARRMRGVGSAFSG